MTTSPGERWPELALEEGLALPEDIAEEPRAFVARVLAAVFEEEGEALALSVFLCGNTEICRIHGEHLDDPTPTDVISFPLIESQEDEDVGATELADGELVVGVEFARTSATEYGNTWTAEIALYLVHGCLHLFGYDDHDEEDLAAMKRVERAVLERLEYAIEGRFEHDAT